MILFEKDFRIALSLRDKLRGSGLTLCTVESLTAGAVGNLIASVSGASEYYAGTLVVYNLQQKVHWLGIDMEHAERVNCVSQRVADEMATSARAQFGTDIVISTTGYAEPPHPKDSPTPYAFITILFGDGKIRLRYDGDEYTTRLEMQHVIAVKALEVLLRGLEELSV